MNIIQMSSLTSTQILDYMNKAELVAEVQNLLVVTLKAAAERAVEAVEGIISITS